MKGDTRAFIGELTHISPAGIVTLSNAPSLLLKNTRDSLATIWRDFQKPREKSERFDVWC